MTSGETRIVISFLFMVAVIFSSCLWSKVEAFPHGERAVREPHREIIDGPRETVAVQGPRGNVAVGTRRAALPYSARPIVVGDRTYYVDDSDVYFLPCEDDDTFYCVVEPPE